MKHLTLSLALLVASLAMTGAVEYVPPPDPPPAHIQADEEIKRAVIKAIAVIPNASVANLRVSVTNGAVTLAGTAPGAEAKTNAEKIARSVAGVQSVKNTLTLRPAAK